MLSGFEGQQDLLFWTNVSTTYSADTLKNHFCPDVTCFDLEFWTFSK